MTERTKTQIVFRRDGFNGTQRLTVKQANANATRWNQCRFQVTIAHDAINVDWSFDLKPEQADRLHQWLSDVLGYGRPRAGKGKKPR